MSAPIVALRVSAPPALPRWRLGKMRRAVSELYEVLDAFAQGARHPVRDILPTSPDAFMCLEHYPPGDVEDAGTGCAWYYHAHSPAEARQRGEHGHFHCFMYTELLGAAARPIALPEDPDFKKGGLVHLIAVSFDASGAPIRLFAPNRWVTGEWMYRAEDIIPLIDRFSIVSDTRFALTSRWLAATLRVCHPQIARVLRERDRVLNDRLKTDPKGFAEDRSLEVVSTLPFNLDAVLSALD